MSYSGMGQFLNMGVAAGQRDALAAAAAAAAAAAQAAAAMRPPPAEMDMVAWRNLGDPMDSAIGSPFGGPRSRAFRDAYRARYALVVAAAQRAAAAAQQNNRVVVTPSGAGATVTPPSASIPIANAMIAKANVDRLFRVYQTTDYSDVVKRNNTRQAMLAAGRGLVQQLGLVRPATEAERLRLRSVAATALASSLLRQRLFTSGASGTGRFGLNEDDGPAKVNAEFVNITRPLDTFLRTRNVAVLVPPRAASVIMAMPIKYGSAATGAPTFLITPARTAAMDAAAKEAAALAAAKLDADAKVAQAVTNAETKAAADKVVAAQVAADTAAKVAVDEAEKAKAAADEATKLAAIAAAKTADDAGYQRGIAEAQAAAQAAEMAHALAEQATIAATEIATVADVARSELEVAATVTNDVPAQDANTEATMTVAVATTGLGPLGVSWKVWGVGAMVVAAGGYFLMARKTTPNKRRRGRRTSRRSGRSR